ncbi:MAG: hypothetical protein AABZ60_07150 [Planctomycetota bacterium]
MQQSIRSNCLYLRTKVAYTPFPEGKDIWRIGESPTSCYWCLRTMSTIGPDENFVAPDVCQFERNCYQDQDNPTT